MTQHYLRTYKPFVLEEVKKNLLIICRPYEATFFL